MACGDDDFCYADPSAAPELCTRAEADAAAPPPDECHPLEQECGAGYKCGRLIEATNPTVTRTTCVPDGTRAPGSACSYGDIAAAEGYDDCTAGAVCLLGTCRAICDVADELACDGGACTLTGSYFEEFEFQIGMCLPSCDPVEQDCAEADGACYLVAANLTGVCAPPALGSEELVQGDVCEAANGCATGHGCLLPETIDDPEAPVTCAFFCNPPGEGNIDCSSRFDNRPDGPGEGFECRYMSDFFGAPEIEPQIGFCVDIAEWGSCEDSPIQPGCVP
jgi:hypothetical protein